MQSIGLRENPRAFLLARLRWGMAAAGRLVLAACGRSSGKAHAFNAGDTLPGYVHVAPRGSRADVRAKGAHGGSQRTVEICRRLDTGRSDDTRFEIDAARIFSLATTNNSGPIHSGSPVVTLAWTGSPDASTVIVGDLANPSARTRP